MTSNGAPYISRFGPLLAVSLSWILLAVSVHAQTTGDASSLAVEESAYYVIETVSTPEDVVLEVGGLALLPSGDIAAATRRGDIWIVENPDGWATSKPHFRRFARGLHEPLGLAFHEDALFATQRGELTRLQDTDGDGRADVYDVVYDWPVSGNYHEYSYGPAIRDDGSMIVALNLSTEGQMASLAQWRGWILELTSEGEMQPLATGMRSPAGINILSDGSLFYTENQGDWIGSGWLTHIERGDFVGHPAGLRWSTSPGSPLSLTPDDVPDSGRPMFEVAKNLPELKPPAVWFPHGILGVSSSGMLEDTTGGAFGPFAGQIFVGDQGHSKIMRVALEKVNGVYQGVVFPFREGFASGVFRMIWDRKGAMYVGMTSRGWDALGGEPYGLQRLRWSGLMPFEALAVHARPDGFEIDFTQPLDAEGASDPTSYQVTGFTYRYHSTYGSPEIGKKNHAVRSAHVDADRERVRIVVDSLREGYVYEIKMPGIRSDEGSSLLHDVGYFTLNRIPAGERLAIVSTHVSEGDSDGPANADPSEADLSEADLSVSDIDSLASGSKRPDRQLQQSDVQASPQAKRTTEMPPGWERPDATITVGTLPGLRYDLSAFEVAPGARVEIIFQNDDDMLHNLVVVLPGTADAVAAKALSLGLDGSEKGYVPVSTDVLFHTALLQPGESESIFFAAPSEEGDYPYVCTFPGHAPTMRGTMTVRE